jgi:hypothetical protein
MPRLLALALCCAALLVPACASDEGSEEAASGELVAAEDAPPEVTGVLLEIDSEGLGQVTSFVLKDGDARYEIFIASDVDYGFDLGHLNEHLTTGDPVRVSLEVRGDELYALAIDDV